MMGNRWSPDLRRHYAAAKTDLDRRAINVCEAWISWADQFGVLPPAELAQRLPTADPAGASATVRQITLKLATACPIPLPMALPPELVELLDGSTDREPPPPPAAYERGPRPY